MADPVPFSLFPQTLELIMVGQEILRKTYWRKGTLYWPDQTLIHLNWSIGFALSGNFVTNQHFLIIKWPYANNGPIRYGNNSKSKFIQTLIIAYQASTSYQIKKAKHQAVKYDGWAMSSSICSTGIKLKIHCERSKLCFWDPTTLLACTGNSIFTKTII